MGIADKPPAPISANFHQRTPAAKKIAPPQAVNNSAVPKFG